MLTTDSIMIKDSESGIFSVSFFGDDCMCTIVTVFSDESRFFVDRAKRLLV